jgi:nitroreductase
LERALPKTASVATVIQIIGRDVMFKEVNARNVDHACNDLFPNRWSPRAMSGEALSDEEINSLFEAARWAPSCMNSQPWRFLYARKNTPNWEIFFNFLMDGNKLWCVNASVLIVIAAKKTFGDKASPTFAFDTGAAWENLALQANLMGLVSHGMAGFDYAAAKTGLNLADDYQILAMVALGKPGRKENLPEELREREKPSDRISLKEFAFEGKFKM